MAERTMKKGLCVDFDGVLHSYTSGWMGSTIIIDPPVDGAIEWLTEMCKHYTVYIVSARCREQGGSAAITAWLDKHTYPHVLPVLVTSIKPAAFLYIDDRAYRFTGPQSFAELTPSYINNFRPWNKP